MRKFNGTNLVFLSIFLANTFCYANPETVQVRARAWPTKITMGDEIKLVVQIDHPSGYSLKPLRADTDLSPFEIKAITPFAAKQARGQIEETCVLTLTVFQLGDLKIPAISFNYADPKGHTGQALTQSLPITVVSVSKKAGDGKDIRPIKGPISLAKNLLRHLLFALGAILLLVFLGVKIVLRRRKKKILDLESLKPPHERAVLELERLKARRFLEEGKTKEFYSELADILRRYLERGFQIDSLERTTFELVKILKERNFPEDALGRTKTVLENSDLVKFAKFIPERNFADGLCEELVEIVNLTKPVAVEEGKQVR